MVTEFTDSTPMPFGKHKGKAMANVPAVYLLWLHQQGCSHDGIRKYISENYEALMQEAEKVVRR
jgi:uncharacterized protein (DUF3820 family)